MLFDERRITGTEINFYFHCKRQLWLFSHHINTEHESDHVRLGRLIHESSYEREHKEIELDNVKLDFLDIRDGILHEVKKSDSWHEAHEWQVLYYLYLLKEKGVTDLKGKLNYPTIRRTITVELTPEKEKQLCDVLENIREIIEKPIPPEVAVKKSICKHCSYYELCWVE